MPVVINEIAWAGTSASGADEWIELYNRSSKTINLANWILFSASDFKPYLRLQNTISAKSFYLIERTNDNTVSDVSADWIGSFGDGTGMGLSGNSANSAGEPLVLVYASNNSTTTIDYIPTCDGNWCAGGSSYYLTMERVNPDLPGNPQSNWNFNNQLIRNGKDAAGNALSATPKKRNSANYFIPNQTASALTQDTTLTKAMSPYFLDNTLSVPQGKTLTIQPGTVIKFKSGGTYYLTINGNLNAIGTQAEPIIFTSFYDDSPEALGDLDGASTTPAKGDWMKIYLGPTSSSTISFAKFKYGGKCYGCAINERVMLEVNQATSTITNSVFEESLSIALKLDFSNSLVQNNIFQNNNEQNQPIALGMAIRGGSSLILNNTFQNNRGGISVSEGSKVQIVSNAFVNNNGALGSSGPLPRFQNNTGSGNQTNGIILNNNLTQANSTSTLYSNSLPYVLGYAPNIIASSTLVIEPNTIIKGDNSQFFNVQGNLIASGLNQSDITFTSVNDGYWRGVYAYPGSFVNLTGVTIQRGGQINDPFQAAGLYAEGSEVRLNNVVFENNKKNGLVLKNSNSSIKNSEFKNNPILNSDSKGISYYNSQINLENTAFRTNFLGIYADSASIVGTVIGVLFENNNTTTSPGGLWP